MVSFQMYEDEFSKITTFFHIFFSLHINLGPPVYYSSCMDQGHDLQQSSDHMMDCAGLTQARSAQNCRSFGCFLTKIGH